MHLKTSKVNRTANKPRPVTVHFPLPKKAISKLRTLAIGKDPRLLDLGVLAVQISDDESIVLGIELEKAKKKSSGYVNKAPSASFSRSTQGRVSFDTRPVVPRSFTSTFSCPSSTGLYANQHLPTARNANFSSKTKKPAPNSAAKRRAKETLNAAKRGRGRGRAGKTSGQTNTPVRASTWEMVYSHIGLPGDHRNKASNLVEPPVGSQASGIAYVPVAQTELPKESILKSESKRKSLVSSPPLKSPGHSGIYSEDDSSLSSSPCSHSPMNSEELMNLFVDSNFSATSVLKQLAESRCKEEQKQTDLKNNSGKKATKKFEVDIDGKTQILESGSAMIGMVLDNPEHPQWGIFPKKPGTPLSKMADKNHVSDAKMDKSGIGLGKNNASISSTLGVGPNLSQVNYSSSLSSSNNSFATSNTSTKRPANSFSEFYSAVSSNSISTPSSESTLFNSQASKRPRRRFAELEIKREMGLLGTVNEQNLQTFPDPLTSSENVPQTSRQLGMSSSPSPNNQFSNLLTSKVTSNMALRNYLQYGYYYSSEDLNKALAKTASTATSTKHETPQQGLYTSASTNNELRLSTCTSINAIAPILKPKSVVPDPTPSLSSTSSPLQHFSDPGPLKAQNGSPDNVALSKMSTNIFKSLLKDKSSTSFDVQTNSPSSSNENTTLKNNQSDSSCPSPTVQSATSGAMTSGLNVSSHTILTSSDPKQLGSTVTDSKGNVQKSDQCYAISYVYPMGTVWYPYVAITPYAMLQKKKDSTEASNTEKDKNDAEGANGASQYIDLASSLRYWQQLSLLYKNQMLVTGSTNPNVLTSSVSTLDQNTCTNASTLSRSETSSTVSDLSKQTLMASLTVPKSERDSFSFTESCSDIPVSSHDFFSNSNFEKKPVRRASVIVAAKTTNVVSSKINSGGSDQHRLSSSTPESDAISDGMQLKSEVLVIDNCNRLIEEHCHRMSEVLADAPKDCSSSHTEMSKCNLPTTPLLSFIPDSSIAYVNVGNNNGHAPQGARKTAGSFKEGKSKSSKKKKSNKIV